MRIQADDLTGPEIIALLQQHLNDMHLTSPPESVHALDLTALRTAEVSFWTLWVSQQALSLTKLSPAKSSPTEFFATESSPTEPTQLAGCGALKQLDAQTAEIKSMRTAEAFRRQGVAARMLEHLITVARERGYLHLYLETGSMAYFAPARAMYQRFGFIECGPFADYVEDPNSVFMVKHLG
jgi:putative acetyltransferase